MIQAAWEMYVNATVPAIFWCVEHTAITCACAIAAVIAAIRYA